MLRSLPCYDKQLALFLLHLCSETYVQYENDGLVNLPEGFSLVKAFKGKAFGQHEWFGFILESENEVVIAFRGTKSDLDWLADASAFQLPFPYASNIGNVHGGFLSIYHSLRNEVFNAYASLSPQKPLYITGHSLGGALATLHALDVAVNGPFEHVTMYNYGSPRVGDPAFVTSYCLHVRESKRFANTEDVITEVPPPVFRYPFTSKVWYYEHVPAAISFTIQTGSITNNHMPAVYESGIKSLTDNPCVSRYPYMPYF
ncbi:lipase family protein [Metabacillus iocasae]|uniref:Triacylglycerol lipase n=1 Tax=Priestia iocasae TaxID=2291674 RepID=A0ABS2QZW9_9BACI|nr:lipase family protein [Metabacillus iocasae]MBM7704281.1 triacylglycerol lipase [Metabacillus iocasae]